MTNTTYGKVADELIAQARRNPGQRVGVDFGYERRTGGRFGTRKHNAAIKLVKAGVFERIRIPGDGPTPLYSPRGGQSGVVYTSVYRLVGGE